MSGDVQPRKRKDKKRKKDELSAGAEELHAPGAGARGTAAIFGESDVFLHTHHDHGVGGHWCAKVIFFSLLAVLITLIGLIILENRGLSELEANSVESRYASVLEGWLEDAPDDDHHDEHTLELKHHEEEEESDEVQIAYRNGDHEDEEHDDDDDDDDDDDEETQDLDEDDHEDDDVQDSQEDDEDLEDENDASEAEDEDVKYNEYADDDDEENVKYQKYTNDKYEQDENQIYNNEDESTEQGNEERKYNANQEDDDEEPRSDEEETEIYLGIQDNQFDDQGTDDVEEAWKSNEIEDDRDDDSQEDVGQANEDEEHEEDDDHDEDDDTEVEHIEREPDEEPISLELPALRQPDDDDDDDQHKGANDEDNADDVDQDDDDDFLEQDEIDNEPPVVERITAPAGKPFQEVDDEETPAPAVPDTLAEEEEYERQQEKLRREQEQASHMWLKLGVGGALLLATHAVLRRAVAPRDTTSNEEEAESVREETPVSDQRSNLTEEEPAPPATPRFLSQAPPKRVITEEMMRKNIPSIIQSAPTPLQVSLDEEEPVEEEEIEEDEVAQSKAAPSASKEELYSDEEIEDEEEEKKFVAPQKVEPKQGVAFSAPKKEESEAKEESPEPEEDVEDDVEIIEEEDLEEELEEEEISDVDDAELLNRLEAKYGRLPDPERPGGYKIPKDGGNSLDDWPGEPSDAHWRRELDSAERELRQGSWEAAAARAESPSLATSARARYVLAKALDELAEAKRNNQLLTRAIATYLELLKMNEKLPDRILLETAGRTVERMRFRGTYFSAEPVHRLLIRRFPDDPACRNNLTITYLMANRADLAVKVLKETLARWPEDRVALAHYAFILKTHYNRLEEAVDLFQKALDGDTGPANEPRFYFHFGDSLLLLGRYAEAHEVHKRAATLGHFLSPAQRSLYNVNRLKSRPWWNVEATPYAKLALALENSWEAILREGEAARALYVAEKEGLRERGEWSQLDLYVRGRQIKGRCSRAPVTCSIVQMEPLATGCRRGQIKFSSMKPGTHVRPHVGPTNCRLRMHLALSNTEGTYLRVDNETRQWQVGKVLLFDDSFEHEVWHNGSATRLVLIVDVWHPDLTDAERNELLAI